MKKPETIPFLRKAAAVVLLGVVLFGLTADPVTDSLFLHQDGCATCLALAGGHGVVSPASGPHLQFVPVEVPAVTAAGAPVLRLVHSSVFLGRAPPAA